GRQGAVRRAAPGRDGSVGDGGLRGRLFAAGVPHREVGRRGGPDAHVRVDRQGRVRAGVGPARVVQRAHQGAAVAGVGRGADGGAARAGRGGATEEGDGGSVTALNRTIWKERA